MTRTDFNLMLDDILNEFDCKLYAILYTDDNIAIVNYSADDVNIWRMYISYRFMNGAKLRLKIMDELNLLVPVNPEIDL